MYVCIYNLTASAASPNLFLRSSRLRTSFSVSASALASSLSASMVRNSFTKSALRKAVE